MALPNITQEINTIKSTYLPKSGGAFNKGSKLDFTGNDDEGYTRLNKSGGNGFFIENYDTTSKIGSRLCLRSSMNSSAPGQFELDANDGVTKVVLKGNPNGTLTWGGNNVITSAGGTMNNKLTFTSQRIIDSNNINGTFIVSDSTVDSNLTGSLGLFPVNHTTTSRNGGFELIASDGTNTKRLRGHYTNDLTWNDKKVVTISAQSTGSTGYRRYADGFTIQWGRLNVNECATTKVTLPVAFSNTNYHVNVCNASGKTASDAEGVMTVSGYTTTTFNISTGYINPNTSAAVWFACGY